MDRGDDAATVPLHGNADRPAPERRPPMFGPGDTIGRYQVEGRIGMGGMGVVYAARDPELDRRVALKVLDPTRRGGGERASARLLREAQAIARLSHPNVVAVYDVGSVAGRVFMAMELIDGVTLRQWCRGEKRTWRDVVATLSDAGRGLAAAHAAGLVHRDFKPDNVIVGEDGRARVLDFGLARAGDATGEVAPPTGTSNGHELWLESPLTQSGTVLGTPAYMAPEQHGGEADPRADQFAFCVVLYEALFGQRPYAGAGVDELLDEVLAERLRPSPAPSAVPSRIQRLIRRGLRAHPNDRYPSMAALLKDLEREPGSRMRRIAIGGGLALFAGAAVFVGVPQTTSLCSGAERKLVGVWDQDKRAAVEAAFRGTTARYAAPTVERLEAALDEYATRWVAVHNAACESTRVLGDQSETMLDLQIVCLAGRLQVLEAQVRLFEHADAQIVEQALPAAFGLPAPEACQDLDALTAGLPPPDDAMTRNQVESIRGQIAVARTLRSGGKYAEAQRQAEEAVSSARALAYAPILAEALTISGDVHVAAGEFDAAEATLNEAVLVAEDGRHDAVRAHAWAMLAFLSGYERQDYEAGMRAIRYARAALGRAGGDQRIHAFILVTRGMLEDQAANFVDARRLYEQALAVARDELGPHHPITLATVGNLAISYAIAGEHDLALKTQYELLELGQQIYGDEHPELVATLLNIGGTLNRQERTEEAVRVLERALAMADHTVGPVSQRHVEVLGNLGIGLTALGRHAEARAQLERALEMLPELGPEDNARTVAVRGNLAEILLAEERHVEAQEEFEELLARAERAFGPQHPVVATVLAGLGEAHARQSHWRAASDHYERALAICKAGQGVEPKQLAGAKFGVAETRWEAGDRESARALAIEAREIVEGLRLGRKVELIDEWLRAHGGPAPQLGQDGPQIDASPPG